MIVVLHPVRPEKRSCWYSGSIRRRKTQEKGDSRFAYLQKGGRGNSRDPCKRSTGPKIFLDCCEGLDPNGQPHRRKAGKLAKNATGDSIATISDKAGEKKYSGTIRRSFRVGNFRGRPAWRETSAVNLQWRGGHG